ncbi:MAG: adenylyltransferase/cytidyltransferase family protein [Candidatus Shapirobacteria bacterium]|jgi:cytidyltransferase-like protein
MISTLEQVSKKVRQQKKLGKKVGLITGCFDVLHFEHIRLFKFAKKHIDFLVIGLDNDKTISLTKGKDRPINKLQHRLEVISELRCVDAVFAIEEVVDYRNPYDAELVYSKVAHDISPDYLITHKKADSYWKIKKERAKHLQIKFLVGTGDKSISSTAIFDKQTKQKHFKETKD